MKIIFLKLLWVSNYAIVHGLTVFLSRRHHGLFQGRGEVSHICFDLLRLEKERMYGRLPLTWVGANPSQLVDCFSKYLLYQNPNLGCNFQLIWTSILLNLNYSGGKS
ncbi:hypothetical protein ACH5RR_009401 [Cinchona calisaya]|uniref:Uncharacterized protein n=1 Tax=Cinchona calisaya TaxID=153742 RepID=A0ABD3AEL4_9GENT